MNILVVNDDGILSPGLACLARVAARFGRVWVVAPAQQCSAMSHRITVFGSLELHPVPDFPVAGVEAWTVSGTPADCVKAALARVLPQKPDLVLSGVNQGYNVGLDILYSGTVGAAMEALANGLRGMAVSVGMGDDYRVVEARLPDILQTLLPRPIKPWEIWNINFPACAPEELRGIREGCRPSALQFYHNAYRPTGLEDGGARLELTGTLEQNPEPGTDMDAVLRNYIAVGKISSAVLKASRTEG
ncbi:MAG: 5'/3'-nucleotidase SurE [Gemmiger sp.]